MYRKAQNLPIWQPVWPPWRWPRIDPLLVVAIFADVVAGVFFVAALLNLALTAWPIVAERLAPPAVAAPVAQPAVEVAPLIVVPAPVAKTVPVQVAWTLVPDAPSLQALFVKNGVLYGVQNTPGGYVTWTREGTKWVSREATIEEAALVPTRDWRSERETIVEILGKPLDGYEPWSVVKSENTLGLCRGPLPPQTKSFSRLFLRAGEETWVELSPPQDMCVYGFVQVGNEFIVTGQGNQGYFKIWQATQQSP